MFEFLYLPQKEHTNLVVDSFSKSEKKFYDLQIYLEEENPNEESKYPKIGYKHKTKDEFVWSNN